METPKVVAERHLPGTAGIQLGEFRLDISDPTHCDLHAGDLGHWRQHDCPFHISQAARANPVCSGLANGRLAQPAR
mgnify:CR=1 FL=1